jgi:hypothetical protein
MFPKLTEDRRDMRVLLKFQFEIVCLSCQCIVECSFFSDFEPKYSILEVFLVRNYVKSEEIRKTVWGCAVIRMVNDCLLSMNVIEEEKMEKP